MSSFPIPHIILTNFLLTQHGSCPHSPSFTLKFSEFSKGLFPSLLLPTFPNMFLFPTGGLCLSNEVFLCFLLCPFPQLRRQTQKKFLQVGRNCFSLCRLLESIQYISTLDVIFSLQERIESVCCFWSGEQCTSLVWRWDLGANAQSLDQGSGGVLPGAQRNTDVIWPPPTFSVQRQKRASDYH